MASTSATNEEFLPDSSSASSSASLDPLSEPTFMFMPDLGVFGEAGYNYEKNVTAFLSLQALNNTDDFCLISNPAKCHIFSDVILCTKTKGTNVIYLFDIRYRLDSKMISDQQFSEKRSRGYIERWYRGYPQIINEIKSIIPQCYVEGCIYKFIFFVNARIQENSRILDLTMEYNLFPPTDKIYKFNKEFTRKTGCLTEDFLQLVKVVPEQIDIDKISKRCIKQFLKSDDNLTEITWINYFKCVKNWHEISTEKMCLTKSIAYKILLFATFKNYSVPIDNYNDSAFEKFQAQLPEKQFDSLWESIKNDHINVSCDDIQYVLGQTVKDLQVFKESHFGVNLDLYKRIVSTSDKPQSENQLIYDVGCLLRELPVIVKNFNLQVKDEWFNFIKVVFIFDKDRNKVSGAINEKILHSLKQHLITTNSGQNFYISDIIDEISYDIPIHELLKLILDSRNEDINKEGFVNRKINKVFLDKTIFGANDLFIVITNGVTTRKFIKYFDVNKKDVFVKESEYKFELPASNEANVNYKYNLTEQSYKVAQPKGANVHILKLHQKDAIIIEWVKTIGNINNIRGAKCFATLDEEGHTCYEQLERTCNYFQNLTIITGPSGVGKTTLLKQFVKTAPPLIFVLLVNLKDHCDYFEKYHEGAEEHLNFFCKNENMVFKSFFRNRLKENKIIVLFDGFDEVVPKYTNNVVKIIQEIRQRNHKIILTTTSVLKTEVENIFNSLSYSLNDLNKVESQNFSKMYLEKFPDYSKFKNVYFQPFLNNPLNLKLISEVRVHEIKKGNNIEDLFELNQLQLFEKFISCKLEDYRKKIKNTFTIQLTIDIPIIEEYYKYFSIKALFNTSTKYCLIKDSLDKMLESYNLSLSENKQMDILNVQEIIVHQNICEYFVAKWIFDLFSAKDGDLKKLTGEQEFAEFVMKLSTSSKSNDELIDIYTDDLHFPNIKLFFDLMKNTNDLRKATFEGNYKHGYEQTAAVTNLMNPQLKIVRVLIENGADNIIDKSKLPSMHVAARNGSIDIITCLIELKIDVNIKNEFGAVPLHYAVQYNLKTVEFLIKNEADCNIVDKEGYTVLHYAVKAGFVDIIDYLLQLKLDVNARNRFGVTPLHIAIGEKMKTVEYLTEHGADCNIPNYEGFTSLHYAAKAGHVNIIRYLVDSGAKVHAESSLGQTPLHYAIIGGMPEAVQYLLSKGAKFSVDNDGATCMHYAAKTGIMDIVHLIPLTEINVKNNIGLTPLHLAIMSGKLEIAKFLIGQGADAKLVDNYGLGSLHFAAKYGFINIIEYLISLGLDVNVQSELGTTPLHYAVQKNLETVECLISNGATAKISDKVGSTCLHFATKCGSIDIISYLIENIKPNINAKKYFDITPLHMAAETGKLHVVQFLIKKGGDPYLRDKNGFNCIDYADKAGHRDLAQNLMSLL